MLSAKCWPFCSGPSSTLAECFPILASPQEITAVLWWNIDPCVEFIFKNTKNIFTFSIIAQDWDDTMHWYDSPVEYKTFLFYIVNTIAADGLAALRCRASAAVVLTYSVVLLECSSCSTRKVNPHHAGTELSWYNEANTMAADALAPCVARSSAAMILTMWIGHVLVFH